MTLGAVFFDIADTLICLAAGPERLFVELASLAGKTYPAGSVTAAFAAVAPPDEANDQPEDEWLRYHVELLRLLGEGDAQSVASAMWDRSVQAISEGSALFTPAPGAVELLDGLMSTRLYVAALSNGPLWAGAALRLLGTRGYLQDIVVASAVGETKRQPGAFEFALRRAGIDAADALYVDSHLPNLRAAALAGMRAARLGEGSAPPDGLTFPSLDELRAWLGERS